MIKNEAYLADDSIKKSLFGIFSINYERQLTFANTGQTQEEILWAFKGSKILDDKQWVILYLNTPFGYSP